MNANEIKLAQQIFLDTIELKKNEQIPFIKKSSAQNNEVEAYITNLLISHHNSVQFFLELEDLLSSNQLSEIEDHLYRNTDFGNYKIIKLLKQGGMGSVFLAKRADGQFERQVVIKMIPIDLDSDQSRNQFEHEKEILALLIHPNIVHLFDSGITNTGQSYFVMELVTGKNIIHYCRENNLSFKQRLSLFNQVLIAIEYAHQHLIIHGDSKPSNIMVNEDSQIKVLDFGIAKLIHKDDNKLRGYSPNYLTPEHKCKGSILTSTDIHQLGQLLLELISDISPKDIRSKKLSFPLLSEIGASSSYSHNRLPNCIMTNKIMNSDIQFIIAKAVNKNPQSRYKSIQSLIEDLIRYKNKYPISARKKTNTYTLSKYIQRNFLLVLFLFLFLIVSSTFTFITISNNKKLTNERDKALIVKNLMTDIFTSADPSKTPGQEVTAIQVLDNGLKRIKQRFETHSDTEVDILKEIAKTYQNLGDYQKSYDVLKKIKDISLELHPKNNSFLAHSLLLLGENLRLMSQHKRAKKLLSESLRLFKQNPEVNLAQIATVKSKLGRVLVLLGEFKVAEKQLTNSTKLIRKIYGSKSLAYAQALNDLSSVYFRQGKYRKIEILLTQSKSIRENLLIKTNGLILDANYATNINNLGLAYYLQGDFFNGEKYFIQANTLRDKIFLNPHPDQAQSLTNLGLLLNDAGRSSEALPYLIKALRVREQTLKQGHMRIDDAKNNLAMVYHENSEYTKAVTLYQTVIVNAMANRGKKHPQTLAIMTNYATTLLALNRRKEAQELFQKSLSIRLKSLPENHLYLSYSFIGLGRTKLIQGEVSEAKSLIEKSLSIRQLKLPKDHWLIGESLYYLAIANKELGTNKKQQLTNACRIFQQSKGSNNQLTKSCFLSLANY